MTEDTTTTAPELGDATDVGDATDLGDATDVGDATETERTEARGDTTRKLMILGGLAGVLVLFGGLYLLWARGRVSEDLADRTERALLAVEEFEANRPETTPAQHAQSGSTQADTGQADGGQSSDDAAASVPELSGPTLASGEILAVNRVPGDDYGRLVIRHVDGTRTMLDRSCVRVHISGDHGVCLSQNSDIPPTFETTFFEAGGLDTDIKGYPSALPSRARISPDGKFSAVTAFVTGSSYIDIGTETTTIVTVDEIDGDTRLRSANNFVINSDEDRFDNLNPQYWGITFGSDEDEIYITGFYGTQPEIMHGTLTDMTIEPTGWVGSCPSLSPDGKTLVFKELRQDGTFELVAVDVATQTKRKLGEARSVDDQVEWLDNDTILYALHPEGGDNPVQPEFDIWMLDIAEGSEPELFLPNADSPAVPRN